MLLPKSIKDLDRKINNIKENILFIFIYLLFHLKNIKQGEGASLLPLVYKNCLKRGKLKFQFSILFQNLYYFVHFKFYILIFYIFSWYINFNTKTQGSQHISTVKCTNKVQILFYAKRCEFCTQKKVFVLKFVHHFSQLGSYQQPREYTWNELNIA